MHQQQSESQVDSGEQEITFPLKTTDLQSPQLQLGYFSSFFKTNYQMQIFRAFLSQSFQMFGIDKNQYILYGYDSEFHLVKVEEISDKLFGIQEFASFIFPCKQGRNKNVLKMILIDRKNEFYYLDLDHKIQKFLKAQIDFIQPPDLSKSLILQVEMSQDNSLMILLTLDSIYFVDLIENQWKQINNPSPITFQGTTKKFRKPLLKLSQCKKCLIVAQNYQIFIFMNYKLKRHFELSKEHNIIFIKLYNNELLVITNLGFIRISNILNPYIRIINQDYFYFRNQIYYAQYFQNNQGLEFAILVDNTNKVTYIDLQLQTIQNVDIQLENEDYVQHIEFQKDQNVKDQPFQLFYINQKQLVMKCGKLKI